MSRDYKPKSKKPSNGNPFLTGFMLGFLLGVVLTAVFTMYLKGDTSPFQDSKKPSKVEEALTEKPKSESTKPDGNTEKPEDKLDFYNILPKPESNIDSKEVAIAEEKATILPVVKPEQKATKEVYYLQAGAFQSKPDAENLKAKLALHGFEALVQTANMHKQGVWHRVRVGPLNNVDKITQVRGNLLAKNFKTDLVKVHTTGN